jgi:glycerophosphoryl diester phosphodiesterase
MVWNVAHRGGAGLHPENTLAAFRDAVARGCDGAELDVQLSFDGDVVVFHDYSLKPEICRDQSGRWLRKPTPLVKDLTLAELRRYDIGRADPSSEYSRRHPDLAASDGERIPTLDEVIDICKGRAKPFKLFVELKTSFSNRSISADPKALAAATLEVLVRHDYLAHAILVGFDWPGLLHAKKLAPHVECWFTTLPQSWFRDAPVPEADDPPSAPMLAALRHWAATGTSPWAAGYDAVNHGGSIVRAVAVAGADGWFPYHRDASLAAITEAKSLGLKTGVWTVDDTAEMATLMERGIGAICTDRPDLMARLRAR